MNEDDNAIVATYGPSTEAGPPPGGNAGRLNWLRWVVETSLLKTFASA